MFSLSRLKYLHLAYFSKPAADRVLYREIRRRRVGKILQIGLPTTDRARRLIAAAQLHSPAEAIRFAGIDLFELRSADRPGMALKEAYRQLRPSGVTVHLVPGDPQSALSRSANALGQMDLVLIAAEHTQHSIGSGWFYLPRLLHARSRVYQETQLAGGLGNAWQEVAESHIEALARSNRPRRAA